MILPQINTFGVFNLKIPFIISSVNYKVTSISLITNLLESGIDVYSVYYSPFNLTQDQYQTDLNNGVSIITLESADGPEIFVPSSYIDTMPVALAVPYSRLVLSLDLGELPDDLPITNLLNNLKMMADDYVGISSNPKLHKLPSIYTYSKLQSQIKEQQRLINIRNQTSILTGKINSDALLNSANLKIMMLEAALVTANKKITELENLGI